MNENQEPQDRSATEVDETDETEGHAMGGKTEHAEKPTGERALPDDDETEGHIYPKV